MTFKEQVELLMAIDRSRVREGRDFSWTFEFFQSELAHPQSHLFEWSRDPDNKNLDGYVISRSLGAGECEIMHMACSIRGAGFEMMKAWLEWARFQGISVVFLEHHAQNEAAHRCYERVGFCETSRRARYYRDGGDAVLMRLEVAKALEL